MRVAGGGLAVAVVAIVAGGVISARGLEIVQEDGTGCDPLVVAAGVGEVGFGVASGGPFPDEWSMDALYLGTSDPVCAETNDPFLPDPVVAILNTSERAFAAVWYVADAGTRLSNWDGKVGDAGGPAELLAFRIDAEGVNRPLISESVAADGVWEPGEVWQFVVQDFENPSGVEVELFGSSGLGGGGVGSSGSLLALPAVAPTPPPVEPLLVWGGDLGITPQVVFVAEAGFSYLVRTSSDLEVWSVLQVIEGAGAEVTVSDRDLVPGERRFYQVVPSGS